MNRTKNTFATILAALVVVLILAGGTLLIRSVVRSAIRDASYTFVSRDIPEDFDAVVVSAAKAELYLYRSDDDLCSVYCSSETGLSFDAEVRDGTLYVTETDNSSWLHRLFSFGSDYSYISVYLPASCTADVHLETVSGDISAGDELTLLSLEGSTVSGDIWVNTLAADRILLNSTSGDISLYETAADAYTIETVSGDISATLPAAMNFDLSSVSGSVYAAKSDPNGGLFEADTVSGDIYIYVDESE